MTEVVTNGAAFLQPFLQPHRQQAFGISNPESPQVALQITAEALRERAAVAATEVAPASDDRSSLQNDQSQSGPTDQPLPRAKAPEPQLRDVVAVPVGPSKARVELPPIQHTEPAPAAPPVQHSAPAPAPAAPAPQPAPVTPVAVSQDDAPAPAEPVPVSTGPLGPAQQLNTLALEAMTQNIIGVAFAPTRVATSGTVEVADARQKNFIFAQRKLYADQEQASGKFAAAEPRRVFQAEAEQTQKFVEVAQPVVNTVATARFAVAENAQKLSDKVPAEQKIVESGEVRMYDKIAQAETEGRFAQDDGRGDDRQHGRESLYQRAQALAHARGSKSDNPEVKKLYADVERYSASVGRSGTTPAAVISPSVIVTA